MKAYMVILFSLMCIAQWYVPGYMIAEQENILKTGKTFRFKTAPVDPSDPFRGKYITLQFEADSFKENNNTWTRGQKIYVVLEEDDEGFAEIRDITALQPNDNADYVEAEVMFSYDNVVRVHYPFERFYLEESKAARAEQAYREANRNDSTQNAFAIVHIKNGKAALENVMINDRSIVDIVRELNSDSD